VVEINSRPPITSSQDSHRGVDPRMVLVLARLARCAQPYELKCPVVLLA